MSWTGPWCTRHGGTHPRRMHITSHACVFCTVCMCALVGSAKVKNGSEPMFFNEASEECAGWTGCVNSQPFGVPPNVTSSLSLQEKRNDRKNAL